MKSGFRVAIILGVAIGLFALMWNVANRPVNTLVDWVPDYALAQSQAAEGQKPIMVKFTARWCASCRIMDEQAFNDERVLEAMNGVVPFYADVDDPKNKELVEQFGMGALPQIAFLHPEDQSLIFRSTGYGGVDILIRQIEDAIGAVE